MHWPSRGTGGPGVAEQARVHYQNGKLTVSTARLLSGLRIGAIDIDIALPSRSRLQVAVASAEVRAEGGFAEGAAAKLDLTTASGVVSNLFKPSDGPAEGDDTLLIRAWTASGDIDIYRAVPTHSAPNG